MTRKISTHSEPVKAPDQPLPSQTYDAETRLLLLIGYVTTSKSDWKGMERETGIPAERWRQFMRGSTKASVQMLEAVAQRWPQYAFWLLTGISDERHGHHPPHARWSFPALDDDSEHDQTTETNFYEKTSEYFRLACRLARLVWAYGDQNEPFNTGASTDKLSKAKRADKRIDADFLLLTTLAELKDREFAANNAHQWTESDTEALLPEPATRRKMLAKHGR